MHWRRTPNPWEIKSNSILASSRLQTGSCLFHYIFGRAEKRVRFCVSQIMSGQSIAESTVSFAISLWWSFGADSKAVCGLPF
jgi:hypothetical protein